MLGIGAELALTEHFEDLQQALPLIALGVGLVALAFHAFARGKVPRTALRLAMLAVVATGIAGLWFHYVSNEEFQSELDPSLDGWRLILATMRAQSPPALAPGALLLLGAIGWLTIRGRESA